MSPLDETKAEIDATTEIMRIPQSNSTFTINLQDDARTVSPSVANKPKVVSFGTIAKLKSLWDNTQ
ncbi:hypothetical protein ACEPPN_017830 [Leptodophora sp. 'Broadleaf-Isolate-01']